MAGGGQERKLGQIANEIESGKDSYFEEKTLEREECEMMKKERLN